MLNALISLVRPSLLKEIASLLLLIGVSGDVALIAFALSEKKAFAKTLSIYFSILIVFSVGLNLVADWPRTLSEAAKERLSGALQPFAGTPFDFSVDLDPESVALMESIADALTAAGWKRQPIGQGVGYTDPGKPPAGIVAFAGLEIQITDSRQSQWGKEGQAAAVLWHSLQREWLTTTAKHIPDNQELPNAIHIKIGTKP